MAREHLGSEPVGRNIGRAYSVTVSVTAHGPYLLFGWVEHGSYMYFDDPE